MNRLFSLVASAASLSLFLALCATVTIGIVRNDGPPASGLAMEGSVRRRLTTIVEEKPKQRPVMHTFFNPLDGGTGMSPEGDRAMIELWKQTWSDAGWEPKILTLKDAENHPEYQELRELVDGTLLDDYNKLCIYRWLAIASVGGGWMSDYDNIPLRDFSSSALPLPNDGELTVHDDHVPDLVSGAANEWTRVARNIVRTLVEKDRANRRAYGISATAPRSKEHFTLWTDMLALHEWGSSRPHMFATDWRVLRKQFGNDTPLGQKWTIDECNTYTPPSVYTIHFAHSYLHKAQKKHLLHEGQTVNDRAAIATEWLATWKESCQPESSS